MAIGSGANSRDVRCQLFTPDWLLTSAELTTLATPLGPNTCAQTPDGRGWLLGARGKLFDRVKTFLIDGEERTWVLLDQVSATDPEPSEDDAE